MNKPNTVIRTLILIFGILLPLLTLGVEWTSAMCAYIFFDPIPTLIHVLLVAAVPIANWWVWYAVGRDDASQLSKLGLANGFALGIASFYTLIFLPLLPVGVIGTIFFGLGLMVMAPLFSLIAAIIGYYQLRKLGTEEVRHKVPGVRWGFALALLILVVLGIPHGITQIGMHLAAVESSEENAYDAFNYNAYGIQFLRAVGHRDKMLEACYVRPSRNTHMLGLLFAFVEPVSIEQAREIYFRVTGVPFNAVPPPKLTHRTHFQDRFFEFDFDLEQGQNTVGGRLKRLFLTDSRLDGSIDAEAGISYTEWTLKFNNRSNRQQEARAEIILPPGGVVSRLTLWIDGEEREAAFAAQGKVRAAYQRIVQRRRDPVLVTSSGKNRVLVQCFPVPVHGNMKIRLGITAPLVLENRQAGLLRLPYFSERNFSISKETQHAVWFEAKQPLTTEIQSESLFVEQPKENFYTIRGMVSDATLSNIATIQATRTEIISHAWSHDTQSAQSAKSTDTTTLFFQTLQETSPVAPQRIIVLVDASLSMRESILAVADTLQKLPTDIEFGLLLASDRIKIFSVPVQKGSTTLYQQAATWLKTADYVGGQDNMRGLLQAWELAANQPNSLIVWIHGPAPMLFTSVEMLAQKWERRPDNPKLYEIQVSPGPNSILAELDGISAIQSIPRLGTPADDLQRLFALWQGETKHFSFVRKTITELPPETKNLHQTSTHLARLWAYNEILSQIALKDRQQAIQIAARYQLVTPVSGAVVLENEAQYQEAKLNPVDPTEVPSIPEPEIWLLLIVVLLILMWLFWQQRRFNGECEVQRAE